MQYTGFKLCESLTPNDKCFRVQVYNEGLFEDVFHQHVPRHRMNQASVTEALKSLIVNNMPLSNEAVLYAHLNSRTGSPAKNNLFMFNVEYPEAGVKRTYCSCGSVTAWVDEVLTEDNFRHHG